MKILLYNDNPVVRKLVALSAQKTKDDLSVVWSVDEIEEGEYDLLIVDDALYSDEVFESINERVVVKSRLFMATRGIGVPAGFDNVINKPFLPTDLVDMFIKIEKNVRSDSDKSSSDEKSSVAPDYAIDLDETLSESESQDDEVDLEVLDEEDFDFGNLEDFEEKMPETAILDKEEVQEVQGLLDDTEEESVAEDTAMDEEEMLGEGTEEGYTPSEEESGIPIEGEEEFSLDDLTLADEPVSDEIEEEILNVEEVMLSDRPPLDEEMAHEELLDEEEFELPASLEEGEEFDEDLLLSVSDENTLEADTHAEEIDASSLMDDEELGDLETEIENAVNGLEIGDLEKELELESDEMDFDESLMEDFAVDQEGIDETPLADTAEFDELDSLDERELKRVFGEETEEEGHFDIHTAQGDTSLSAEALDEVMSESARFEDMTEVPCKVEPASHSEGVEALQALLKALANEDVAKSLKGLNISININFGNEK